VCDPITYFLRGFAAKSFKIQERFPKLCLKMRSCKAGDGMSIITDALKKAESERELKGKHLAAELAPIAAAEEKLVSSVTESILPDQIKIESEKPIPEIQKFPINRRPIWENPVLIIASIFVLFFLIFLVFSFIPKKAILIVQSNKDGGDQKQIIRSVSRSIESSPIAMPYVLSGVSKLGSAQYAIINGMIVQKGESIDGAFVSEISERKVTLETKAGKIQLKIQS